MYRFAVGVISGIWIAQTYSTKILVKNLKNLKKNILKRNNKCFDFYLV